MDKKIVNRMLLGLATGDALRVPFKFESRYI